MKRILAGLLIISIIVLSGCVSTKEPVDPQDIIVNTGPVIMKEFQDKDISVRILNNATDSIDSVMVTSFEPFTVARSGSMNIPGKKDKPAEASLEARITSPGFKESADTSTMIVSYASGSDQKGNPIIKTKSIPVQTTVLPDAVLQFVGFVKDMDSLRDTPVSTWPLRKGENATLTFSVKNEGKTTIDENTLVVQYDVENKRIGTNGTFTIKQAMAKGGTSYTQGMTIPVLKDAPNGETDVYVTLLMGDHVIDSKTIVLKVIL